MAPKRRVGPATRQPPRLDDERTERRGDQLEPFDVLEDVDWAGAAPERGVPGVEITRATLTGGGSSFQLDSFVGADLTGAVLIGGGSSFQAATFQRARLTGVRILCRGASFQAVNIDGADLCGADLSTLESASLELARALVVRTRGPPRSHRAPRFQIRFTEKFRNGL